MKVGAHLPLMDFGDHPFTLDHLVSYAETATALGYSALSANDHLVFAVPWLDGPTALAAVLAHSGDLELFTTVANPVVRGPVALAKSLGAVDRLSGGRLVVGVGPGSSANDYAVAGLDFEERWKRLDEAVVALRSLWRTGASPIDGRFYSTGDVELTPRPSDEAGPPIWIGSWGSEVGLRRVARLADGWLASAYNTTPADFGQAWLRLQELLGGAGHDPGTFPNGLATMWYYLTDDPADAERVRRERLGPAINRPEEVLRERLPVGSAEAFAEKLDAFQRAGLQRVFIWPVADEVEQLHRFHDEVLPLLDP